MREIKFRAWDSNEKKMMYDNNTAEHDVDWWDGVRTSTVELVNTRLKLSFVWMEYTGLKDKNGVEIYEGDILCWPQYEGTKNQTRWFVKYSPEKGFCSWSPIQDAVIIGNIYENPELLTR